MKNQWNQLPLMNAIRLRLSIRWEITIPFDHLSSVKLSAKHKICILCDGESIWANLNKLKKIYLLKKHKKSSCFWSYYAAFHLRDSTIMRFHNKKNLDTKIVQCPLNNNNNNCFQRKSRFQLNILLLLTSFLICVRFCSCLSCQS